MPPGVLRVLPCLDSPALAAARQAELKIDRARAASLGRSAVADARAGFYLLPDGRRVAWGDQVRAAVAAKVSVPPGAPVSAPAVQISGETAVQISGETAIQVTNETTTGAAWRLLDRGLRPLALNFASATSPGGGFLLGSRAQEESLCRSGALYLTLAGDPMYAHHAAAFGPARPGDRPDMPRPGADPDADAYTDWAILSPDVPFHRDDAGEPFATPRLLSILTCAAPYAKRLPAARAAAVMEARIPRVLEIAAASGYDTLVLGAWGCGAFGNDPAVVADIFWRALSGAYAGRFREVAFAITDWSEDRRFLGPFRDRFA